MEKEFKICDYKTDLTYYISLSYKGKNDDLVQELENDLLEFEKYLQEKYIKKEKASYPFFKRLMSSI